MGKSSGWTAINVVSSDEEMESAPSAPPSPSSPEPLSAPAPPPSSQTASAESEAKEKSKQKRLAELHSLRRPETDDKARYYHCSAELWSSWLAAAAVDETAKTASNNLRKFAAAGVMAETTAGVVASEPCAWCRRKDLGVVCHVMADGSRSACAYCTRMGKGGCFAGDASKKPVSVEDRMTALESSFDQRLTAIQQRVDERLAAFEQSFNQRLSALEGMVHGHAFDIQLLRDDLDRGADGLVSELGESLQRVDE